MPKEKKYENRANFRITNIDTLNKFNEVMESGLYSSKNELVNKCIEMSIDEVLNSAKGKYEKLYKDYDNKLAEFEHSFNSKMKKFTNAFKELQLDVYANSKLSSTLYAILIALMQGSKLQESDIAKGLYAEEPPFITELLSTMRG